MNLTLNNGVEMPALGFGVFQTPPVGGITSYRGTGTSTFDAPAIAAMRRPRQDRGAGHDPLAPAGRPQRDLEVGAARADRRELRCIRLPTDRRVTQGPGHAHTGVRDGPGPGQVTLENFGRPIPEV